MGWEEPGRASRPEGQGTLGPRAVVKPRPPEWTEAPQTAEGWARGAAGTVVPSPGLDCVSFSAQAGAWA